MIEQSAAEAPATERRSYWPLWVGLGVLAVILSVTVIWPYLLNARRPHAARVGAFAPEITLAKLQNGKPGDRVALSTLKGHPLVVNFWATWCVPCRQEFPAIEAKYLQYKDSQQLVVIGINAQSDAGPDAAQRFVNDLGATFPIWLDSDGSAEQAYDIAALPTTIFIDRQGVIQDIVPGGPMTPDYLDRELHKLF